MNIRPALFFTIEDLYPVLDKGVVVEFRKMVTLGGMSICEEAETKFLVYVRYFPPKLDLEEDKLTIMHELTHASIVQKGLREPKTEEAKLRRENQIEEHAQLFRGKKMFFRSLLRELMDRRNCSVVFHGSIFDGNGKTECPFFHYYCELTQQS